MSVEEVRKWLENLCTDLMRYDVKVFDEAKNFLCTTASHIYSFTIPLIVKYRNLDHLKRDYHILFSARVFIKVDFRKTLDKEMTSEDIEDLLKCFTYVYSPNEYKEKMIEVGNEIGHALRIAIERVTWRKQLEE